MHNLTVCFLILSALALSPIKPEPENSRKVNNVRQNEVIPCYVVISNEMHNDNKRREIKILMDKADINETNFVRLHQHFSAKYPDVERLSVYVNSSLNFTLGNYTTVEDIEALREVLAGFRYKKPKLKVWEKDAQGILMRIGETEFFRYKMEGTDSKNMKSVLVKGEARYCPDCKRLDTNLADVVEAKKSLEDIPCYFVIENFVMEDRRFIRLFINAEDGREPKLIALLMHFSEQHLEPEPLVIKAYTNLKQEYDFLVQNVGEHFVAVLFRDSGNKVIRYRRPHENTTTVIVHGVDIFPDLDDYRGTEGYRVR